MAASTIIKNLTDGQLTLSDGTGVPVTLVVNLDSGDLSVGGLQQKQNEVSKYESRGAFKTARHTTRTYPSGSFSFMVADISDATDQTVIDFLLNQNSYSANQSTLPGDVYAVDIQFDLEGTDFGDTADHQILLGDCVCRLDFAEGDPDLVTCNFEVLGTITMS